MEGLLNQKLFIDKDCPMCKAYSTVFVKLNMLDESGVVDYTNASDSYFDHIDVNRARNEIALYNKDTQEVKYGLESLLFIITSAIPFLKNITDQKLVLYILKKLYNFISYNRKVVVPVIATQENKRACVPDFNPTYRTLFIIVLGVLSNVFLYQYLQEILLYQEAGGTYIEEFALLILQFLWHGAMIYAFGHKDKMYDYLGQLAVVLFIGGILLMALKMVFVIFSVTNSFIWLAGLTLTALAILIMLYKRCEKVGDPNHVIFAWFTFRLLVGAWWFYDWGLAQWIA